MGNGLQVRAASSQDVSAIVAIYAPQVLRGTASFELETPDADEMLRRMAGIIELGLPYLVAEIDGEIAGYAYVSRFRPRAAYHATGENSVNVAERFPRRGVARQLMHQLMDRSARIGLREMIAVIGDPTANSASVAFHRSLGFKQAGVLRSVGEKFGRALDVMMMQQSLR